MVTVTVASLFSSQKKSSDLRKEPKETETIITDIKKEKNKIGAESLLAPPIENALSRITTKTFGTHVSPKNSPVSPERFTGYHTGVDFETFAEEQNTDVLVYAICTGKLVINEFGRGYGGMAVESCELDDSQIIAVYGHIRITSVTVKVGEIINKGEKLAVLGTGYGRETDGERKHLHLGIHKGSAIDTRGYVADKDQLLNWINVEDYL